MSFHPAAFLEINEISEFIAADNFDAADRILDELRESIKKLVDFSEMGFRRDELTSKPLRVPTSSRFSHRPCAR